MGVYPSQLPATGIDSDPAEVIVVPRSVWQDWGDPPIAATPFPGEVILKTGASSIVQAPIV